MIKARYKAKGSALNLQTSQFYDVPAAFYLPVPSRYITGPFIMYWSIYTDGRLYNPVRCECRFKKARLTPQAVVLEHSYAT
jgi:hypothetical protein